MDGSSGRFRDEQIEELRSLIREGDPAQIAFQTLEIAGDRVYEQNGITVGPGDTVIDASGNIGVSAVHFAVQCGADAVHSFEPVPETFSILEANLAPHAGCFAHQLGLFSSETEVELTYFTGGDSVMSGIEIDTELLRQKLAVASHNLGMTVEQADQTSRERLQPKAALCRMTTLSAFISAQAIETVGLLKIDVEGAELQVLEGIEEADWPRIRQVVAEIHGDDLLESAVTRLESKGFSVAVDQDESLTGTDVRLIYGRRKASSAT